MHEATGSAGLTPLAGLVGQKAIAWAEDGGMQRVVVARASAKELRLPPSVTVSHKELVGRARAVRGDRLYGNASMRTAFYANEDQEIMRVSSLVCVTSGRADFQIGDYILHCPEGTFIFIPPGLPHPRGARSHLEGANRASGSCDLLWFSPRGRRVQCWTCSSRGAAHRISNGRENVFLLSDRIAQYFDTMEEEAAAMQANHERMFHGALLLLLLLAHRELTAGRFLQLLQVGSEEFEKPSRLRDYDPVHSAQEFIRSNLAASLTIDRVAGAVHMSRARFTRRFHEQVGCTFVQYINQCRLEQAKIFLRDTDWAVSQVSEFVGFRSTAYFHTIFRRATGQSPIEYRVASQHDRRNTPFETAAGPPARRARKRPK